MIDRVEIIGADRASLTRDPLLAPSERLEVRLRSERIYTMLPPVYRFDDPRRETREEFARRLRYAASETGRYVEGAIIDQLNRMGHLV